MKKISLLIYEDVMLSATSGALDMLSRTNRFLKDAGKPPAFQVELVGEKKKNIALYVPAQFVCHKTFQEVTGTDLIIVPAFYGDPDTALKENAGLVKWIKEMHQQGTEVASLCRASYFLAEAGLLSGKPCTSHWVAIDDMRKRYPDTNILSDRIITDQDGIYTSGGAFSSLNLILYLIEKFCGRDTGIWISKLFAVDMDRDKQAHFAVFQGQRQHDDKEILKAQEYIEQHYRLPMSIEQIAGQIHMSKRNFIRRFKDATKNTPLEYLQRVKIESAKKALERNAQDIGTLVYEIGYNDVKTFRKVFKRITGLTPLDYRRKYSREEMSA